MDSAGRIAGVFFTAEIGFKQIVFTFREDGAETERHVVKPEDIQSVSVEPDGSTKLAIRLHRDLTVPTTLDESSELEIALERVLEEVKAVELRKIEAGREARKIEEGREAKVEKFMENPPRMSRGRSPPSKEDYEKIPDD